MSAREREQARAPAAVLVSTQGGPFPDVSAAGLRKRALKMLEHLGLSGRGAGAGVELSIALVGDAEIRELNRSFRRKDKPTDVLAFPMSDDPAIDFPEGGRAGSRQVRSGAGVKEKPLVGRLLGDVILSIETARRQAEEGGRPLAAELTMLLAHGLLHLLGYDHQTDKEEREMTALTRELEQASTRAAVADAESKANGKIAKKPASSNGLKRVKVAAGVTSVAAAKKEKRAAKTSSRAGASSASQKGRSLGSSGIRKKPR